MDGWRLRVASWQRTASSVCRLPVCLPSRVFCVVFLRIHVLFIRQTDRQTAKDASRAGDLSSHLVRACRVVCVVCCRVLCQPRHACDTDLRSFTHSCLVRCDRHVSLKPCGWMWMSEEMAALCWLLSLNTYIKRWIDGWMWSSCQSAVFAIGVLLLVDDGLPRLPQALDRGVPRLPVRLAYDIASLLARQIPTAYTTSTHANPSPPPSLPMSINTMICLAHGPVSRNASRFLLVPRLEVSKGAVRHLVGRQVLRPLLHIEGGRRAGTRETDGSLLVCGVPGVRRRLSAGRP